MSRDSARDDAIVFKITVYFLLLFAVILLLLRQCGHENPQESIRYNEVSRKIDSLPRKVQIPSVTYSASALPQSVIFSQNVPDSSRKIIAQLLVQIDSLKREVRKSEIPVSVCFGTTAIHPQTMDTIRVECDAIRNAVHLDYRFALRTIIVPETTITIERVPVQPSRWSIALSSGYGAVYQNSLISTAPILGLTLSYSLISF